jgi:hypothetical protein
MTKENMTPGPWYVKRENADLADILADDGTIVAWTLPQFPSIEANSQAIAATPELIKALKDLTRYCTSGERYKTRNPYAVPEIKQALIALTKAQGKSPEGHAWMDALREEEEPEP